MRIVFFSMKQIQSMKNLSCLPVLNEELVIQVLQNNYINEKFYTWGGKTLLAINPCTNFENLYTQEIVDFYYMSQTKDNEPHIYAVAENARYMLSSGLGKVNQAIIVSGESGAGKTYTTAHVLKFLTTVASDSRLENVNYDLKMKCHQPQKIQQQIIDSTPLLEAFGNASTSRNKNSSRFGKLIQLQYCGGQFAGAKISTYLLEKTRVATTTTMQTERNYNIFYQIVAGSSVNERNEWMLNSQLTESLMADTTDADQRKFLETKHAMSDIGLSDVEQKNIFQVLSSILHLKQLKFKTSLLDSSILQIDESNEANSNLERASALLGIDPSELKYVLTIRTIIAGRTSRKSVFSKPCSVVGECETRRDCLIKLLYDRLFEWLVSFINRVVAAVNWDSFIGILDVYGFESFDYNSLEQLCINFANEKLQQYFVKDFLHDEQELFLEEGIDFCLVDYTDNKHCLDVLEGRSRASVFGLLNEDCQLHWQNDPISVTKKLLETLKENCYIEASTVNKGKPMNCTTDFIIRHYAGKVKYSAKEMINKNKDNIPAEFISMLANSSKLFISELSPTESGRLTPDKKTRKQTVLSKFKASLDDLVDILNLCDTHYIRCLVPNVLCQPSYLDPIYLSSQLKACGILESIAVSQAGLPVRMSYGCFVKHYSPLFGKNIKYLERLVRLMNERNASFEPNEMKGCGSSVLQQACRDMIYNLLETTTQKNCQFGKTKLFLSSEMFHCLEKVLSECQFRMATLIQCAWRKYSKIRMQKEKEKAALIIQKEFRRWKIQHQFIQKKNAAIILQRVFRLYIRRHRRHQGDIIISEHEHPNEPILSTCSLIDEDIYHSTSDSNKTSLGFFNGSEKSIDQFMLQDDQWLPNDEKKCLIFSLKNYNKIYQNYHQQKNFFDSHHESFSNKYTSFHKPSINIFRLSGNKGYVDNDNYSIYIYNVNKLHTNCLPMISTEIDREKKRYCIDEICLSFFDNYSNHLKEVQQEITSTYEESSYFSIENIKSFVNLLSNEITTHDIIEKNIHSLTDWTLTSSLKRIRDIANNSMKVQQCMPEIEANSTKLIQSSAKQNETLCKKKINTVSSKQVINHYNKSEGICNKAFLRNTFNTKDFEKLLKFVPTTGYKQQSKLFSCRFSVDSSIYNKTLHLYSKDGVVSIRRMPTTKLRFHTRLTVLPYSHIPPLSEVQCSLTDALENEKCCLLHKPLNAHGKIRH